jgi:flavin reductase (DIM6/NTAB) family NADH-FMN oxidoreductase RutF
MPQVSGTSFSLTTFANAINISHATGSEEGTMMQISGFSEVASSFKQALRGIASTVTVITAHDGARHHGMTATAVTSLCMEPPALLICLNRATLLHDILTAGARFCVNVLDESQAPVSAAFSGALPPGERFALGEWSFDESGLGFLTDAQANIFCSKVAATAFGTHTIFIGEVSKVRLTERQAPLIYKNASYCTTAPQARHACSR